jgi:hypothetical protein
MQKTTVYFCRIEVEKKSLTFRIYFTGRLPKPFPLRYNAIKR